MTSEQKEFIKAMGDFISDCGQWNAFKDFCIDNLDFTNVDVDRLELEISEIVE